MKHVRLAAALAVAFSAGLHLPAFAADYTIMAPAAPAVAGIPPREPFRK